MPLVPLVAAAAVLAAAWFVWHRVTTAEPRAIAARLQTLCDEINSAAPARPEQIGSYFTTDAVVDLGRGTAALNGRETIVNVASRLQNRTAAFRLELDDIGVTLSPDRTSADASLTATFALRTLPTADESRDAREFHIALTKADGTWRIHRVTAVPTLR
jgi:hypothetical protein